MDYCVKDVQQITGISKDTLRYYDNIGLLQPKRGKNGYRLYTEMDIDLLKYLCVMKYAGFRLIDMKEMLQINQTELSDACNQRAQQALQAQLDALKQKIDTLTSIQLLMEKIMHMVQSKSLQEHQEQIHAVILQTFENIQNNTDICKGTLEEH